VVVLFAGDAGIEDLDYVVAEGAVKVKVEFDLGKLLNVHT